MPELDLKSVLDDDLIETGVDSQIGPFMAFRDFHSHVFVSGKYGQWKFSGKEYRRIGPRWRFFGEIVYSVAYIYVPVMDQP